MVILPPVLLISKFSLYQFDISKKRADLVGIKWNPNIEKLGAKERTWDNFEAFKITLILIVFGVILGTGIA